MLVVDYSIFTTMAKKRNEQLTTFLLNQRLRQEKIHGHFKDD